MELPEQTVALPVIIPGWAGMTLTVTASVAAADDPHALLAVTVTFPLVALAVALIEFVVEVPVHPPGRVQV